MAENEWFSWQFARLRQSWWIGVLICFLFGGGEVRAQTVAIPVLSPVSGASQTPFSVTVTDATSGASLYYTIDGSTPTTASFLVTNGKVLLAQGENLKVLGVKSGYTNSAVASETYEVAGLMEGGFSHSLALRSDGTVWSWGLNDHGELGDGTTLNRYSPVQVISSTSGPTYLSGVVQVAAGNYFSMALKSNGTVWCWGPNSSGELGNASTATSLLPVEVLQAATGNPALSGVTAISAGAVHCLALTSSGTVWAWGAGSSGQLGNGGTAQSARAVQVTALSGRTIVAIAAGYYHNLALDSTGEVWVWGDDNDGQLGDGSGASAQENSPEHLSALDPVTGSGVQVVAIAAGAYHSLALKSDGTVVAWGLNNDGQVGNGTTTNCLIPTAVSGFGASSGVIDIQAGGYHTLALKGNGTVWSWGNNDYGELGAGNLQNSTIPEQMTGVTNAVALGAGDSHSFVIRSNGTVYFCGRNEYGQAGDGTGDRTGAVQVVTLGPISALDVTGGYHGLAVNGNGTLWSFGSNLHGELGDATTNEHQGPEQVPGLSNIVSASSGQYYSLALSSTGTVTSWGYDGNLQLGYSGATTIPTGVPSFSNVSSVGAQAAFSLALKNDGTLWSWGNNSNGQLGTTVTNNSATPKPVQFIVTGTATFPSIGSFDTGSASSLAVDSAGNLWTWGSGANGQLGLGSTTDQAYPTKVTNSSLTGSTVKAAFGQHFAFALNTSNQVWAWGYDADGELGDGGSAQQTSPVHVSSLDPASSGAPSVVALSGGSSHGMALKSDGSVWAWGLNSDGQLGNGTMTASPTPTSVLGVSGVVAISAGGASSLVLKQDGTIEGWGNDSYGQLAVGQNYSSPSTLPGVNLLAATPTPTVAITAPANNATLALGQPQTLTATAGETGGSIASVSYYLDSTLIGTSTNASSYSFSWTPTTWGNFTFTAVATDTAGNTSYHSAPVTFQVLYGTSRRRLAILPWHAEYPRALRGAARPRHHQ